jgi:hypothetical protein
MRIKTAADPGTRPRYPLLHRRIFFLKFFCYEVFAKQKKKKRKEKTLWTILLTQVVATCYVLWCLRAICMYTEKLVRNIYAISYYTYVYTYIHIYTGGADILCGLSELGCSSKGCALDVFLTCSLHRWCRHTMWCSRAGLCWGAQSCTGTSMTPRLNSLLSSLLGNRMCSLQIECVLYR